GRICTDLAEVLEENGHECKIAYGRMNVPEKYQKYAICIGNSFTKKIDAVCSRLLDNTGFNSWFPTLRLVKQIKEFTPDIIHLHNLHGSYINIKILFKFLKKYNKPVVWTLHDCWTYTGHCAHFTNIGCEKWRTQCFKCPLKHSYPKSLFLDNSVLNYKLKKKLFTSLDDVTLITPSQWLADVTKQSFMGKYNVIPVPNGIDLEVFKPTEGDFRQRYGLEGKVIVLGVASSWDENKGLDDFVKLAGRLDDAFKVVLVGLTNKQLSQMPESILGITRTHSVHELAEIYTTADVFLNLTYQDTYPTVNLEAQACGTPVITYSTGGSVESADQENVVPCGDIDILLHRVKELTSCDKDIEKTLKKAKSFKKELSFCKYLEIYEQQVR
ncbi:MAG: glycosyltransferase, partial [Clostridia bacterium]|nr:glycosyltransferase [Clostridia bacterium]